MRGVSRAGEASEERVHTCTQGLGGGKTPLTRVHAQPGVSCLPLLLSSLKQIPGTGLKNLNENPPCFDVLPLQPAVAGLPASNRYNALAFFIRYSVWPLLPHWASHRQPKPDPAHSGGLFFFTLGREILVLNPEIVYV